MIKLYDYDLVHGTNGDFKSITFECEDSAKIDITITDTVNIEVSGTVSIDDLEEAIAIVRSGKLEVELWPTL